ncbi:hypothetical protein BD410DRAFT_809830 [Rickenella mellea]|uniref:Uncharacterized protein n=1 Tax=Rickenella mellea TaxID=50990 RepID=A0A4Y7PHK7_9AGAM|nr:hypothetical protein BD410DRAFT_809830 [Rickenella mellea]
MDYFKPWRAPGYVSPSKLKQGFMYNDPFNTCSADPTAPSASVEEPMECWMVQIEGLVGILCTHFDPTPPPPNTYDPICCKISEISGLLHIACPSDLLSTTHFDPTPPPLIPYGLIRCKTSEISGLLHIACTSDCLSTIHFDPTTPPPIPYGPIHCKIANIAGLFHISYISDCPEYLQVGQYGSWTVLLDCLQPIPVRAGSGPVLRMAGFECCSKCIATSPFSPYIHIQNPFAEGGNGGVSQFTNGLYSM